MTLPEQAATRDSSQNSSASSSNFPRQRSESPGSGRDQDLQQQLVIPAVFSEKLDHVVLSNEEDALNLESKGFGIREGKQFFLKDYEVLYLMYNERLVLTKKVDKIGKKSGGVKFTEYVGFAKERDEQAWSRFLIFRDLRSRGYVVREGFGFPIDFRVYDRGDYGTKAAKYIVFGLNEGKTMTLAELKKHVDEMSTMGKEAVIAVIERRGEVIYYKVGKWRPIKPL